MKLKQIILLGAGALMLLASCSDNRPEYKQRVNPPYTVMERINGFPKKIVYKVYYSDEYVKAGSGSMSEVLELDPKGYEKKHISTSEANRQVYEYTYDPVKPGKLLSVTTHIDYIMGGSEDYVNTFYYDANDQMTRRVTTTNGAPYSEILITIDEKGYPVEKKFYDRGKTDDDWNRREEYKYKDGNMSEILYYSNGSDKPFKKEEVIDDTAYKRYYPSVEWFYNEKGELRYANRTIYNSDMLITAVEKTEDGETWTPVHEYTINSHGNTETATYHGKDGDETTTWTYTYDPQGNWITKTDGEVILVREIEYY